MQPTNEQSAIIEAYGTGEPVAVEALAGTGKTSTLKLLAESDSNRGMTYVAYNRAIADEARGKFPQNVTAQTMHSFAMRSVGKQFSSRLKNSRRMSARETADILGVGKRGAMIDGVMLQRFQLTRIIGDTLNRFMSSDSREVSAAHVPYIPGIDTREAREELAEYVLPYAQSGWQDLTSTDGKLRFTHGVYLKLFELSEPVLPGEVILADEYQDTDPVIKSIIEQQCERGAQLIAVGDSNQQIYEWRGAVDALAQLSTPHRLPLQQSFRFGPRIAEEANLILQALESPWRLYGNPGMDSRVVSPIPSPDCVLTRTNAGSVAELFRAVEQGTRTAIVGGTGELERMADGADALQRGEPTSHPELMAFSSWREVLQYVEDEENSDSTELRTLVTLVNEHGTRAIREVSRKTVENEGSADLVISTAHKSKGRQWNTVRLGSDFTPPFSTAPGDKSGESEPILNAGEARLQYVGVTRAQYAVDSTILDWIGPREISGELPEIPEEEASSAEVSEESEEHANVICDPEDSSGVLFVRTRYDSRLVERFRAIAGRRYSGEYAGYQRVNIVPAGADALQCALDFRLTVSPEARERCEQSEE